ncbi:MAG TPA: response regulator [Methanomassiliicoccales archaeon]
MRILCTDDDPMLLDVTQEFLSTNGFEVDVAYSAAEALQKMEKTHYDALVSDYQMPDLDGIQLLKHLRALPNNIPFILFTGRGREEIAIEALNSGADYYIQKGGEPGAQFAELTHHIIRAIDRREAEAKLGESIEKFRALVEVIGDWRWEMDAKGTYTYCSPQVFDVIGYQPSEMIGKRVTDFIPRDDRAKVKRSVMEGLSSEGGLRQFENIRMHRDGSSRYIESSVVPVLDKREKIVGYRGVDRDVTREKEMEGALEEANHRLEILESVTWHDTMNQLSILSGNVELLRNDPKPEAKDKYLRRIETAANSVRKHIDFTRNYQRTGKTRPVWLDVSHSFSLASSMLDLQDVRIECTLPRMEIKSDPMLVKAFFNMMENSLRYGQKVTEIRLSAERDGDGLTLIYSDNGVGIPLEDKDRIFLRGFGNNTGLGMFLIKSIFKITNIDIKETGFPGEGIRLEMYVPKDKIRCLNEKNDQISSQRKPDGAESLIHEDQSLRSGRKSSTEISRSSAGCDLSSTSTGHHSPK